jgi:acetate kinase
MNVLALNPGSNSLKFEIVAAGSDCEIGSGDHPLGQSLVSGVYDDIGKESATFSLLDNKRVTHREPAAAKDHGHATKMLFDWISRGCLQKYGVTSLSDIDRIGFRVVHGADWFSGPAGINDDVLQQIEQLEKLAPLHNRSALAVIRAARERVEVRLPMVAVFDTAFHRTIPDEAALYPLPLELSERHKIRRYGFHGISHRYLMLRYAQITRRPLDDLKIITLHLEGGSSAAAILRGNSIDTTMGFTPLEGLMMASRCGDIDPSIVTYLMREENLDCRQLENLLNKKCGLLGVSGRSPDTRELVQHLSDPRIDLTLNMFCYRVRKYIGAYLAILGGAEAIVFGGGIGENTPSVRERVCCGLEWCGVEFDTKLNAETIDREGLISTSESRVQVWVIPTKENLMLASETANYNEG